MALRDQLIQKIEHAQEVFLSLQISQAEESVEDAARRLQEIRTAVERATHLKKQKLQIYLSEVESLTRRINPSSV